MDYTSILWTSFGITVVFIALVYYFMFNASPEN
ncbi:aspartate carbamoyltransferase catalytic subunit [Caminibacter mediatlanticus TB-2]|uniref:Aspartate carbamoyltransferase catalytic subunit n=1 Tax=Caminibacter mediatlanticus TB-2 TaxID=391592 RepID=A0AAI9F348_9BACT|nr:aspartate carbamoyltransferase catalytic subunit [Caminibacter mediatlanticus TB-2]